MQIHELNTFSGIPEETDFLAIDTGFDTAKISAKELLKWSVENPKTDNAPDYGDPGQILRTKGDGSTEWSDVGLPTDEQTEQAINKWLDDHPEATTTVQDGSITEPKLEGAFSLTVLNDYVTPEMYGAKGDGVTDDTQAIQDAINSGKRVVLDEKTYLCGTINLIDKTQIDGVGWGSVLLYDGTGTAVNLQYVSDCRLSNLTIFCNKYNTDKGNRGDATGIKVSHPITATTPNTWSNSFYNVRIHGFTTGVHFPLITSPSADNYASETLFINCKIFENDNGVICENLQSVNNSFIHCQIERNNANDRVNNPLITMIAGMINLEDCSLIGAGPIVQFAYDARYSSAVQMPIVNINNCRAEIHPPLDGSDRYIFVSDIHTAINSEAYLRVRDTSIYFHVNNIANYLVYSGARCFINITNVDVHRAGGSGTYAFAYIKSVIGYTGYIGKPYSFITGEYISGLDAMSVVDGSADYMGVCTFNGLSAAVSAHFIQPRILITDSAITIKGDYSNGRYGSVYFNLPSNLYLSEFVICSTALVHGESITMELYKIKDKANWADPSAANPSSSDMYLIASATKPSNKTGAFIVPIENSANANYNVTGGSGFTEGRYLIKPSAGTGITGFCAINYY